MIRRREKPPEHLANSLYLEWFGEANGRVVVESADYELSISPGATPGRAQIEDAAYDDGQA